MAATTIWWTAAAALVVTALAACSSTTSNNPQAGPTGDDTQAGFVARNYVRAITVGHSEGEALLGKAYALLLPRQRAAIPETFYTGCVLQDDTQGNDVNAQVRKIKDNDDVVPPGYSRSLPTKTVWVTLPADYNQAPDWYGKLRVSKDSGRWYVSVAAAAFQSYSEGNCEYSIWEYPEPPPNAPLPPAVRVPARTGP